MKSAYVIHDVAGKSCKYSQEITFDQLATAYSLPLLNTDGGFTCTYKNRYKGDGEFCNGNYLYLKIA